MKQISLATKGFELVTKSTRYREFLDYMNLVIPWSELLPPIAPQAPAGKIGRHPFATELILRIQLLQQFFGHSGQAQSAEQKQTQPCLACQMYKHLSRIERYQIHSLLKAKQTISEIARLLGRHRSTISRELDRGRSQCGYSAEQACSKASERAQRSSNASRVVHKVWSDVSFLHGLQWSTEQITAMVEVSHWSVYLHVYANKGAGGDLHTHLRIQKPRRKRHLCGRDRRGQIPNRPISDQPSHIEDRKQVGLWEGDTVIGAAHKQVIVTLLERKSCFALLAKVSNKTVDLVGRAIQAKLMPLASKPILLIRIAVGSAAATRTSMVCCANTIPRSGEWKRSPKRN
jgi:IS30 family transposase